MIVGIGPWWGWGYPYGYGYGYGYYPPPAYAYDPPVVVEEEPPVYAEREAPPGASDYWYYCESLGAYYPRVERCPEEWVKVPPRP